jgi:hypothetical protein
VESAVHRRNVGGHNTESTDRRCAPAERAAPGSVHPSGGHQVLHGPLTAAQQLAAAGNPPAVLDKLMALLAAELAAIRVTSHNRARRSHPRRGAPAGRYRASGVEAGGVDRPVSQARPRAPTRSDPGAGV